MGKYQVLLTKTYGNTTVQRLNEDRWAATYQIEDGDPEDVQDHGSYVRVVAYSEDMATMRLIEKLGDALAAQGYRGVIHG